MNRNVATHITADLLKSRSYGIVIVWSEIVKGIFNILEDGDIPG